MSYCRPSERERAYAIRHRNNISKDAREAIKEADFCACYFLRQYFHAHGHGSVVMDDPNCRLPGRCT